MVRMDFGVALRLIEPAVLRTGCIARRTDLGSNPRRKLIGVSFPQGTGVCEIRVVVGFDPGDGRSSQRSFTVHGDAEFAERQRRELVDLWGVTRVGVTSEGARLADHGRSAGCGTFFGIHSNVVNKRPH